jgi:hypothetical protein
LMMTCTIDVFIWFNNMRKNFYLNAKKVELYFLYNNCI